MQVTKGQLDEILCSLEQAYNDTMSIVETAEEDHVVTFGELAMRSIERAVIKIQDLDDSDGDDDSSPFTYYS